MFRNYHRRSFLALMMIGSLIILASALPLAAQAGLGVAGGHTESAELSFSYSVGQVFNETIYQSGYYVSQGIQHPSLLVINDTTLIEEVEVHMNIYPNPAADELYIDLPNLEHTGYNVQLINIQGQVLVEKTFKTTKNVLSLEAFKAGHYLLRISADKSAPRTFTIIKTK